MDGVRRTGIVIQGFDIIDISRQIVKTNKKHQAVLLSHIENIIGRTPEFDLIRKLVLDETSEFCRDTINFLFGDINKEF
jgi:hypothetical protein